MYSEPAIIKVSSKINPDKVMQGRELSIKQSHVKTWSQDLYVYQSVCGDLIERFFILE